MTMNYKCRFAFIAALSLIVLSSAIIAAAQSSAAPKFLYAVNEFSNNISAYTINPNTGALTPVAGSPFATPALPHWMAVSPSGNFAYAVTDNSTVASLVTFSIDSRTGALTQSGTTGLPSPSFFVPEVEPSGKFLLLAGARTGAIDVYRLDAKTGLPSSPASFPAGNVPWSNAIDPLDRFVYLAGNSNRLIGYSFDRNTGQLAQVPGSPVQVRSLKPGPPTQLTNQIAVMHTSGNFLYITDPATQTISAYRVNPGNGSVTAVSGSPFSTQGVTAFDVALDPTGRYLYVGDSRRGKIAAFSIAGSGALEAIPGSPFVTPFMTTRRPGGAIALAVDPSGHFLYASSTEANQVAGFAITPGTGALVPIAGSPVASGTHPFRLVISR